MSTAGRLSARDRLLRAADSLLFQRGIRVTAVDDVLREAEVSTASLYTHFGSKDALTAEVLRIRFADWQAIWDRCAAVVNTDEDRLLSVFDALAEYREGSGHASRWCAFLTAAHELGDTTPDVTPILAEERELLTSRLLHFSRPLAGDRAQELADQVHVAYTGALASFLSGVPGSPITVGRRLARAAVRAHSTADYDQPQAMR